LIKSPLLHAERLQMEDLAALALRTQTDADAGSAGRQRLASSPRRQTLCGACLETQIVLLCMHMCARGACTQLLRHRCPVCCGPIELITQVFT
jgi:hypothetical protein